MAKFSDVFLQGLLQPTYQQSLFEAARGLGQTPGIMMLQKQKENDQRNMLRLFGQASAAADQGDVKALGQNRSDLAEILATTTDENTRELIMDKINAIDEARPAVQDQATLNTAKSIIKTEDALAKYDEMTGPLSENEEKARAALQERLAVMKQNGQAVVQADKIKFDTQLNSLKNQNALIGQQEILVERELGKYEFGSEAYEAAASSARSKNLGQAVDRYEKIQYELIQAKDAADKIRENKEPLTESEIQTLKDYGFNPDINTLSRNRKLLGDIQESTDKKQIAINNRRFDPMTKAGVEALIQVTLLDLQKFGDIPYNVFSSDLYDKIEDLLKDPKEMEILSGLLDRYESEGLTQAEVTAFVYDYIKQKFPNEFKDAETYRSSLSAEQVAIESTALKLLLKEGLAVEENGVIKVLPSTKQSDIDDALEEAEKRMSLLAPDSAKSSPVETPTPPVLRGRAGLGEVTSGAEARREQAGQMFERIGERMAASREEERASLRSAGRPM